MIYLPHLALSSKKSIESQHVVPALFHERPAERYVARENHCLRARSKVEIIYMDKDSTFSIVDRALRFPYTRSIVN